MKRKYKMILLFLTLVYGSGCKKGYRIEKDYVYYEYWNEGNGQKDKIVQGADPKTFKSFTLDCDCDLIFGKDKNHLYINGIKVNHVNPKEFEAIEGCFFRDNQNAYYLGSFDEVNGGKDYRILGVNPHRVKVLNNDWAKADELLIYEKDTLLINEMEEFIPIDNNWGKTKNHIIYRDKIINGADLQSFEIIDEFDGKDKYHIYEFGFIYGNEFIKSSVTNFNFNQNELLNGKAYEFTDIYTSLLPINEATTSEVYMAEWLKPLGFELLEYRKKDWSEGPLIITVTLSNKDCECFVEKAFFTNLDNTDSKVYRVTERLHCHPRK